MAFLVLVVYLNTNCLVFSVSCRLSDILKERERLDTQLSSVQCVCECQGALWTNQV